MSLHQPLLDPQVRHLDTPVAPVDRTKPLSAFFLRLQDAPYTWQRARTALSEHGQLWVQAHAETIEFCTVAEHEKVIP